MTLSTAKLLKENGWVKPCITNFHIHKDGSSVFKYSDNLHDSNYIEVFPAPSTDELLAELPYYIQVPKDKNIVSCKGRVTNEMFLHIEKGELYWASYTDSYGNYLEGFKFDSQTFSTALALLWIKLKQENIGG